MIFSAAALINFYFKEEALYSLIYAVGFFVLNINLMKISLRETLSMYKDISKSEAYKLMAYTDSLTSIENRNAFIKMENEIKIDSNTSFIIMDINGLKRVNDTRGHHYGDKLIRRAASLFAAADIAMYLNKKESLSSRR